MTEKLFKFFKDKRVLVLGFGLEGRSTLKLLQTIDCGAVIGIADKNLTVTDDIKDYELFSGDNYLSAMDKFDIVMKSPGIALFDKVSNENKAKITSQTDLLLRFSDNVTVGVTGTKGKSTTSSLINHILKTCGKKSELIGNIGIPPLENIFGDDTAIVCEMSCHQLEYVRASPDIAVILNIYEEHLDHYSDFNAYKEAKENIYLYQDSSDLLVYNLELANEKIERSPAEKLSCSAGKECDVFITESEMNIFGIKINLSDIKTHLPGIHNLYNIAVALAVCIRLDCPVDKAVEAIGDFKGLPHRLEYIGKINGIEYIDDSISTIPLAAISAVNAFSGTDTLILGGMDRGINYDVLIDFLLSDKHKLKNLIVLPDSGYRIAEKLDDSALNIYYAKDLCDASEYSKTCTKIRCILSPAAASYGFYKNFEERGEHFKQLINDNNT